MSLDSIDRADDVASLVTSLVPGDGLDAADRLVDSGKGLPVWAGLAAILAALGPRGRWAAVAGLLGAAAGSASSNGLKPVVDRKRPANLARRLHRTASFPSSHATTGAAFASSAAVVDPRSLLLTAPAVAAVSFSRVHSRQHHVGDVAGGVVLGTVVGSVVGLVVRRARRRRAVVQDGPAVTRRSASTA